MILEEVAALKAEASRLGPEAPDRDRRRAVGVWADEYADYSRFSSSIREDYDAVLGLRYGAADRHILDVYLPRVRLADAPVFVFFHGGALEEGHPRRYGFLGRPYLERGAIFISAGYRLM